MACLLHNPGTRKQQSTRLLKWNIKVERGGNEWWVKRWHLRRTAIDDFACTIIIRGDHWLAFDGICQLKSNECTSSYQQKSRFRTQERAPTYRWLEQEKSKPLPPWPVLGTSTMGMTFCFSKFISHYAISFSFNSNELIKMYTCVSTVLNCSMYLPSKILWSREGFSVFAIKNARQFAGTALEYQWKVQY